MNKYTGLSTSGSGKDLSSYAQPDVATHPIQVLNRLQSKFPIRYFYVSTIIPGKQDEYVPDVGVHGPTIGFESGDVETDLRSFMFEAFLNGLEAVIHSEVETLAGQTMHIPQADFANHPSIVQEWVNKQWGNLMQEPLPTLFNSGRSLHGYGEARLLTPSEWTNYMGSLLLLGTVADLVTDARWVGHSLARGWSALRLTKNSENYMQIPTLVKPR